jgi:hypothetical protein
MKKRRGQSMVEFALVLPILIGVIFGIIEGALIIQGYLTVQHAAREAARFAVTNRPLQGACLDLDEDGVLDNGLGDGDPDDQVGYPYCPESYNYNEPEEDYYRRRVDLIKEIAHRQSVGLRIEEDHLHDFGFGDGHEGEPRFFGVRIWGVPSFRTDCNDPDLQQKQWDPDDPLGERGCLGHPGLEGASVRVFVKHNVEIADPIYSVVAEYVTVRADVQMTNEGLDSEFGGTPPPAPDINPDLSEITPPPFIPTRTPTSTTPITGTPTPVPYTIDLSPETATNIMPDDRSHVFNARVMEPGDVPASDVAVAFATDFGSFDYSGIGYQEVVRNTDENGWASVTIYANYEGTANVSARTAGIADLASKTWSFFSETITTPVPYITVSSHEVVPDEEIQVDVMDHVSHTEYSLWWCVSPNETDVTSETVDTEEAVLTSFSVDEETLDLTEIDFTIPAGSLGLYRFETHQAGGDCGDDDVAYSADVRVLSPPPDLTIDSLSAPRLVCPQNTFTISAFIENLTDGSSDETFDVDFYVDPIYTPPQKPIGDSKQWVAGIDERESMEVMGQMWLEEPGEYTIWARVDTSDYVDEREPDGEGNNAASLKVTVSDSGCGQPTANEGSGFERNPSSAYVDGGAHAENRDNQELEEHQYYDFGLDIPSGITIRGIEVRLDWWLDDTAGDNSIEAALSWDGGEHWTGDRVTDREPTSEYMTILGGSGNTWGRSWSPADFSDDNFRVRLRTTSTDAERDFYLDWVAVRVTGSPGFDCTEWPDPPPDNNIEELQPPQEVCYELINLGGFESTRRDEWYDYWVAGDRNDAYAWQSEYYVGGSGTKSLRLHASQSSYEQGCAPFSPWLYQTVELPTEVYTTTTMHVRGQRLVAESQAPCSEPGATDGGDMLRLSIRDSNGITLGASIEIANGGDVPEVWNSLDVDVGDIVEPYDRPGEELQIYFDAPHDGDEYGTWFYLDELSCEVCTRWDIPELEDGKAFIGGELWVWVRGIPQNRPGVDVWAYSQSTGKAYHTFTTGEGQYVFYNIEPGTYTIYSEVWVSGGLYFAIQTVTVSTGDIREDVDLSLM